MQKILDVLREAIAERNKIVSDAASNLKSQPDFTKRLEESQLRAEEHRREDREFQATVIAELQTISALLRQLVDAKAGQ